MESEPAVETITSARILARGEQKKGVVFFKVEITTDQDMYDVDRRYTHFANLAHHIRGFPRFDEKPFPGKMLFNNKNELDKRQQKLEVWLQGIIKESISTCPQLQRFIRLFALRSPKTILSKAVKKEKNIVKSVSPNDLEVDDDDCSVDSSSSLDAPSRARSVDGTLSNNPIMFNIADIRPRSGSVCSEESDISDLSDASEGMLRNYVGGPHATTASLCQEYNSAPDLITLVEDIPKSFTTPKKQERTSPLSVEEVTDVSPCEKLEEDTIALAEVQPERATIEQKEKFLVESKPTTPIEQKLARLGLADRMVVVSPQKRKPIKKEIRRPERPAQAEVMPWWADWAVAICGLTPA